ncbi:MAG: fibronectin type III domain-containing protein, partial [Promethearchaeota archaeon]
MKLKKSKIAIISLLFLCIFIWAIPSSYLSNTDRENELLVRTSSVNIEGILNGGFETGEMTYWHVYETFRLAHVSTGFDHTGAYGCQIYSYGGGSYHLGIIEQNLTHAEIYADDITSFSFWRYTYNEPIRVTVIYWDYTSTSQTFTGAVGWEQHHITGMTSGKRLRSVRIEGTEASTTHGGIDDVSLLYETDIPIVYPPILADITPNPDTDGDITLDWSDVPFADSYTVYRHRSLITELNSSVDSIGTTSSSTYTDLDLIADTHCFVVTASNETGTSLPSNCKSVVVDLPEVPVEGILNGGFETGEMTYWHVYETFRLAHISTGFDHTGTYGCQIYSYGAGSYHLGIIEQNLTHAEIYSHKVNSFSFWRYTYNEPIRVTVIYWDYTSTSQTYTGAVGWEQHHITGMTSGKRLRSVRIEGTEASSTHGGIDDVSINYNTSHPITYPPILAEISPNPDMDGDIILDWDDVPYMDNYTVYRHSSLITELNGSVAAITSTIPSTFTDLDLPDGTYYYVVAANNETGTSVQSNCKSVVVNIPAPDEPYLNPISPNPDLDGNIYIDWNDIADADNYTVYRYSSLITELNGSVASLDTALTSEYMNSGLSEGTYYYAVTATNETGTSGISNCQSVIVDLPGPDAPILYPVDIGYYPDPHISVHFDPVPYADNYTKYYYTSYISEINGSVHYIATDTSTSYGIADLDEGMYYFVAFANNETGPSEMSNCVGGLIDYPGPNAPILDIFLPNPDYDGNLDLLWDDIPNADNYTVYRHTSLITDINGTLTNLGTVVDYSYSDLGLSSGMYYYAITATNENGTSSIGNCQSVLVISSVPDAPILNNFNPSTTDKSDIYLTWNDVPGATLYTVCRSDSFITEYNSSVSIVGTSSESSYTDIGLGNGVYYYAVFAENPNGLSAISNCESIEVKLKIPGYSVGIILGTAISIVALMYYR